MFMELEQLARKINFFVFNQSDFRIFSVGINSTDALGGVNI